MIDEPKADDTQSETRKNLVAAGKIGGFLIAAFVLFFLFILIAATVAMRNP